MSQNLNQIGFLNMTMSSLYTVTRSHLWDEVERELRALDVHPTNLHQLYHRLYKLSYQYGPSFLNNAFSTLLNQCDVKLRQFSRRKG